MISRDELRRIIASKSAVKDQNNASLIEMLEDPLAARVLMKISDMTQPADTFRKMVNALSDDGIEVIRGMVCSTLFSAIESRLLVEFLEESNDQEPI